MRSGLDAQERAVIIGSSRNKYDLESIESAFRSQWSNEDELKSRDYAKQKVTAPVTVMYGEDTLTREDATTTPDAGSSYQDSDLMADLYDEEAEEIADGGVDSFVALRPEEMRCAGGGARRPEDAVGSTAPHERPPLEPGLRAASAEC